MARRLVMHQAGRRIGFDIVAIPGGERAVLSRKNGPSRWPKVCQMPDPDVHCAIMNVSAIF